MTSIPLLDVATAFGLTAADTLAESASQALRPEPPGPARAAPTASDGMRGQIAAPSAGRLPPAAHRAASDARPGLRRPADVQLGSLPAGAALSGVLAGIFGLRVPAPIGGAAIVVTGLVIAPVLRTSVIRQASEPAMAAAESA